MPIHDFQLPENEKTEYLVMIKMYITKTQQKQFATRIPATSRFLPPMVVMKKLTVPHLQSAADSHDHDSTRSSVFLKFAKKSTCREITE